MVLKRASNFIKFLKTTAIGGLIFLLPLIVIGALIGQIAPIVMSIATSLAKVLPSFFKTPSGIGLLIALTIGVILLLCFGAGILARRSFIQRLGSAFEKQLAFFFPRYTILKDQMADSIGGEENRPQMKPVLIRFNDVMRIGFETERCDAQNLVTVYLPGSPDPWAGKTVIVDSGRVEPLKTEFGDAVATCEQVGRGSIKLIADLPQRSVSELPASDPTTTTTATNPVA